VGWHISPEKNEETVLRNRTTYLSPTDCPNESYGQKYERALKISSHIGLFILKNIKDGKDFTM
jgi:hypothetical protein